MLLRSGRATFIPESLSGGFTSRCSSASRRRLKRKPSVEVEAASIRRVRSKSPASPCTRPVALHPPEVGGDPPEGIRLHPPEIGASQHDGTNNGDGVAELLGVKLSPHLPREEAAAMWVGFVNDAKACIEYYNNKHQTNFVYKQAHGNGFYRVEEQDDSCYYHMNFQAQDRNGLSQLFFAEIRECVVPQVDDVTCCCPVSSSDAGGKGIRTIEEAVKHVFPDWDAVDMDQGHCYCCTSRVKHPKGTCYIAGHVADPRQYYALY